VRLRASSTRYGETHRRVLKTMGFAALNPFYACC
jgi:hypothetical protein